MMSLTDCWSNDFTKFAKIDVRLLAPPFMAISCLRWRHIDCNMLAAISFTELPLPSMHCSAIESRFRPSVAATSLTVRPCALLTVSAKPATQKGPHG